MSPVGDTGESILARRLRRDEVPVAFEAPFASGLCGLVDCSGLPAARPGRAMQCDSYVVSPTVGSTK